jgi:hypothetical protein
MTKHEAATARPKGYVWARANGGYYWHLRPKDKGRALCGFKPKSSPRSSMDRGYWAFTTTGDSIAKNRCPECIRRTEKL